MYNCVFTTNSQASTNYVDDENFIDLAECSGDITDPVNTITTITTTTEVVKVNVVTAPHKTHSLSHMTQWWGAGHWCLGHRRM